MVTTAASGGGSAPGGRGSSGTALSGSPPRVTVPPKTPVSPASGGGGGGGTTGGSMTTTVGLPDSSRRCELQPTSAPTKVMAINPTKCFCVLCFMGSVRCQNRWVAAEKPRKTEECYHMLAGKRWPSREASEGVCHRPASRSDVIYDGLGAVRDQPTMKPEHVRQITILVTLQTKAESIPPGSTIIPR